jgi:N-acetylmuramoyl-L-alanine amidase
MRRVGTARLSGLILLALLAALVAACADDGRDAAAPAPSVAVTTANAAAAEDGEPETDADLDTPPDSSTARDDESSAAAATAPTADRTPAPEPDEAPPEPDEAPSKGAESEAVTDAAAGDESAAPENGTAEAVAAENAPPEAGADDDPAPDGAAPNAPDGDDTAAGPAADERPVAATAPERGPAAPIHPSVGPTFVQDRTNQDESVADLAASDDEAPDEPAADVEVSVRPAAEPEVSPVPPPRVPVSDDPAANLAAAHDPLAHFAAALPSTEAAIVAPPRLLIVLDPGHGGDETGAHAFGVVERESNLDFALRVEVLLVEAGYDVLLTRRTRERPVDVSEEFPDAPDFVVNRPDLQARVDLANEAGANIFVSIHSNGHGDARASGVEVYWSRERPHAEANRRLALALHESVLEALRVEAGYRAWDRGIREDTCWDISRWTGECEGLFLLGPATEIQRHRVVALGQSPEALGFAPGEDVLRSRATEMPAALLELLFITNEWEAGVLKNEIARQAMALGIVQGIERYFAETAALADGDAAAPADTADAAAGG